MHYWHYCTASHVSHNCSCFSDKGKLQEPYHTLTYTDKKVKEGKTYKYKIRSYSVVSGKKIYSSFSSVRKVSLKRLTVRGDFLLIVFIRFHFFPVYLYIW